MKVSQDWNLELSPAAGRLASLQREVQASTCDIRRHFAQDESFFLRLCEDIDFPSLPVHHNLGSTQPPPGYVEALDKLVDRLQHQVPGLFQDLRWVFDPRDLTVPKFLRLLSPDALLAGEKQAIPGLKAWLHLLELDLKPRLHYHEMDQVAQPSYSPAFHGPNLFCQSLLIPLEDWEQDGDWLRFRYLPVFRNTWVDESGRGYFVTGSWLDGTLERILGRFFFPDKEQLYPYAPLSSISGSLAALDPVVQGPRRYRNLPLLRRALAFLLPRAETLKSLLKPDDRSSEPRALAYLQEEWSGFNPDKAENRTFAGFRIRRYLSEQEQREYEYHED